MSYDLKCHNLAESFLSDTPHTSTDLSQLAQTIQDAIEDFIAALPIRTDADAHVRRRGKWMRV